MNLNEHIDIYCERLDATFWAEPLNAITNLSFIVAAYLGYKLWKHDKKRQTSGLILVIIAFIVGIGSFLFHTIATRGAMLGDIIPIILFVHFGFWMILQRFFGFKWYIALLGVIGLFWFNWLVRTTVPVTYLNGSVQYLTTLAMLITVSLVLSFRGQRSRSFAAASIIFFIAIIFRSSDMMFCSSISIGTHFLWHLLNGAVVYHVIRGILAPASKD